MDSKNIPNFIDTVFSQRKNNDLTLSLPQMGPSFNFYKFKGMSEAYKNKFREK